MMDFCVFSFNRGQFLKHCVESIERCAPTSTVSIYDDASDDRETRQVLADLGSRHSVVESTADTRNGKHGGLYSNMQRAFEDQPGNGIVCFIQDDMQLVRKLSESEIELMAMQLEQRGPRFLHPAFLKGCNRAADSEEMRYEQELGGYLCNRFGRSAGAHYSDIHISSVAQLRLTEWCFLDKEALNEQQARGTLQQMLILRNPFVAWLPNVPAWRGRTRTLALRRAERKHRSGFYPIRFMSTKEETEFLERSPHQLPVAEDYLELYQQNLSEPWQYHPLQNERLYKALDSVERRLRKR